MGPSKAFLIGAAFRFSGAMQIILYAEQRVGIVNVNA